jgi:hypothetical protein
MESSEQGTKQRGSEIQMVDDPVAGLQRPVPHARNNPTLTTITGPMVVVDTTTMTTTNTTKGTAAPIVDTTTKFGRTRSSSSRQRSFTRIEGMEKLNNPILDGSENLSEAEKRMKEEELSFYSASDNDHGDDNIWGLLSGVGGNIYEWYVYE